MGLSLTRLIVLGAPCVRFSIARVAVTRFAITRFPIT